MKADLIYFAVISFYFIFISFISLISFISFISPRRISRSSGSPGRPHRRPRYVVFRKLRNGLGRRGGGRGFDPRSWHLSQMCEFVNALHVIHLYTCAIAKFPLCGDWAWADFPTVRTLSQKENQSVRESDNRIALFAISCQKRRMSENSEIRMRRPNLPRNSPANCQADFPDAGFPGEFPGKLDAEANFPRNSPGNFPGSRMMHPSSRGIHRWWVGGSREMHRPRNFHGFGISREIGRPGLREFPRELIEIKSGIAARRRRSGGPHPQGLTRLEAIPSSPMVGAGVSGASERLGPPSVPEFR